MSARVPRLLLRVLLVGIAEVLAHNLTFLLTYGSDAGSAMASTGHGGAWNDAVATVLAAGALMLVAAALRLRHLTLVVRDLEQRGRIAVPRSGAALAPALLRLWLALAPATAALFVLQENLEHASAGEPLPLLGVLFSPAYPVTIPVVALVALAVAAVAALFRASTSRRCSAASARRWRPAGGRPRALGGPPSRSTGVPPCSVSDWPGGPRRSRPDLPRSAKCRPDRARRRVPVRGASLGAPAPAAPCMGGLPCGMQRGSALCAWCR